MYKLGDDKKIREFLETIKKDLPEDNGVYIDRFILNEYKSRRALENRTRNINLDYVVKLYNRSKAKYKKVFANIHGIGYIELTKKPDINANPDTLENGSTICFKKIWNGGEKIGNDFIQMHNERFIELQNGKKSDIYLCLKGYDLIKLTN